MMIKNFLFFLLIVYTAHITAPLVAMDIMPLDIWKPILAHVSARNQLNFASTCKTLNRFYNEYGYDIPCSECVIIMCNIMYDQKAILNVAKKTKATQSYLEVQNHVSTMLTVIGEALTHNTRLSALRVSNYAFPLLKISTTTYASAQLPLKTLIIGNYSTHPGPDSFEQLIETGWLDTLLKQMPQLEEFECYQKAFYRAEVTSSPPMFAQFEQLFVQLKKLVLGGCIIHERGITDLTNALQKNTRTETCVLNKIKIPRLLDYRQLSNEEAIALAQAANTPGNPLIVLDLSDNGIDSKALCIAPRDGLTIRL